MLGSRIPLIAGDALVLAVTQRKTYYRLKKAADAAHMKTSKAELLLRNGACALLVCARTLTYDRY